MTPLHWFWSLFLPILLFAGFGALALHVDENDPDTVKKAAATVASDLVGMYNKEVDQTGIPGKLEDTWWVGGAIFMTLIQYWYITGDDTYNDIVTLGMLTQKGEYNDYFPANWSSWLGNDDQIFWGLAAITAAELNYPQKDGQPSWVSLAQGVFNSQSPRWDMSACGGGLRWQCAPYQAGWDLKNSVSNGGLFQLSSRLYYYTSNETYSEWANKIWDWSASVPLINTKDWNVADSTNNEDNCTKMGNAQWTYNYGMYFSGSAYMYNITKNDKWKERVNGLLKTTYREFFPKRYGGNIMSDYNCEIPNNCDGNSALFKGVTADWMAMMTTIMPDLKQQILPKLKASAVAAADQCSGGSNGDTCGSRWYQKGKYDGTSGIGQEMSSLSVLASSLIGEKEDAGPKSAKTGGKSKPNPNAGTGDRSSDPGAELSDITTGDKAGAGILTVVFVVGWIGAMTWMLWDR